METRATPWGPRPADWPLVRWRDFAEPTGTPVRIGPDAKPLRLTVRTKRLGVVERRLNRHSATTAPPVEETKVEGGEFLISKIDARKGAAGIIPESLGGAVVSGDFRPYKIVGAHSRFIYHLVGLPTFWRLCDSISDGSTNRVRLDMDRFEDLPFPLPPLREQAAIASVLDAIDDVVEGTDVMQRRIQIYRSALLTELLSGHSNGLPPLRGGARIDETQTSLGDVVEIVQGQVDPRDPRHAKVLFVAPDDIESGTGVLLLRRTVGQVGPISGKYMFRPGDVLFSKIRPNLRKAWVCDEAGLCSADVYPLRPRPTIDPRFLMLVLLSPGFAAYARTCSDRTGIPKVNRVDLLKFRFRLPPLTEQRRVAALLGAVGQLAQQERERLGALRLFRRAVSDSLLTGLRRLPASADSNTK